LTPQPTQTAHTFNNRTGLAPEHSQKLDYFWYYSQHEWFIQSTTRL